MKNFFIRRYIFYLLFFIFFPLSAQNNTVCHNGRVSSLIQTGDNIISAGEDGFICIWSAKERKLINRLQLSYYALTAMVKHPNKDEICVIEAGDTYRISAWNYKDRKKLFSVRSEDGINYINYSANGSFIIAGGLNGSGITLLDSSSGEIKKTPFIQKGIVSLAATGKSEKNMLVYQVNIDEPDFYENECISYIDLETGTITNTFEAPAFLQNPVIFGNNRYIAGLDADGLVIVDAASGKILSRKNDVSRNALLRQADEEFYCLDPGMGNSVFYRFSLDRRAALVTQQRIIIPVQNISSFTYNKTVTTGTQDGGILTVEQNGRLTNMSYNRQLRVIDIAASSTHIAFLTEDGFLGYIPLDYNSIKNHEITLSEKKQYSRITALNGSHDGQFILWRADRTQIQPLLINEKTENYITFSGRTFPLRSISSLDNKILFLDSGGNLSVFNADDLAKTLFTFSSAGAIDADFINANNIIFSRSVISGNSPFLRVNTVTGETVSLNFPAEAGISVLRGSSGKLYAAAVSNNYYGNKTVVLRLGTSDVSVIKEFPGEEHLSVAEIHGNPVIASSNENTAIYGEKTIILERTDGLTQKLTALGKYLVSLDTEGNITWFDGEKGSILAVLKLYANNWIINNAQKGVIRRP
jgi:WD40 repeat protein